MEFNIDDRFFPYGEFRYVMHLTNYGSPGAFDLTMHGPAHLGLRWVP